MSNSFETLLDELRAENSLKAWSVIITYFGDSISTRGGAVSAGTIQEVMEALTIGSGAVRTALSRLCKDGWVERTRSGRKSYYRLAEKGIYEFAGASARIYQALPEACYDTGDLYVVATHPHQPLPQNLIARPMSLHGKSVVIAELKDTTAIEQLTSEGHLVCRLQNNSLPAWVLQQLLPALIAEKYQRLSARVDSLLQVNVQNALLALATRTLLIHEWRRIRLRHNPAAVRFASTPTVDEVCHKKVALLYSQLTPLAEHWLDTQAQGPNGPLPVSDIVIDNRFR